MQQETKGGGCTHGVRHLEKRTQYHLGEFVSLRIRHNKEDKSRNEGIFSLEKKVQHLLGGAIIFTPIYHTDFSTPFLFLTVLYRVLVEPQF